VLGLVAGSLAALGLVTLVVVLVIGSLHSGGTSQGHQQGNQTLPVAVVIVAAVAVAAFWRSLLKIGVLMGVLVLVAGLIALVEYLLRVVH
jgi:hypothetical protein